MDSVVTQPKHEADPRFDTARITAAIDAIAEKHSGREDVFRAAVAQFLKGELLAARATAQAGLRLDPDFTIRRFRAGVAASDNPKFHAGRERM